MRHLDMAYTPENTKEMYIRLHTVPRLVWCHAVDAPSKGPIEDEDGREHRRPPKHVGRHAEYGLVSLLDDTVLLWRVCGGELALHALLGAVLIEGGRGELATTVSV